LAAFVSVCDVDAFFPWLHRVPLERNYEKDRDDSNPLKDAKDHPLLYSDKPGAGQVAPSSPAAKASAPLIADPLSAKPDVVVIGAPAGFVDPLSAAAASVPFDPLGASDPLTDSASASPVVSRAISTASIAKKLDSESAFSGGSSSMGPKKEEPGLIWASKKAGILSKYTTTESLSVPYPTSAPKIY
jgi:hypothetical protein